MSLKTSQPGVKITKTMVTMVPTIDPTIQFCMVAPLSAAASSGMVNTYNSPVYSFVILSVDSVSFNGQLSQICRYVYSRGVLLFSNTESILSH